MSETREQEMAAALDAAIDALQSGRPFDAMGTLARFPELHDLLTPMFPTVSNNLPPTLPIARPEQIARYRIERELGSGSFGVVYLAYDPDVKRRVAIKVLNPSRIDQPEAITRFQREAHANGRLRHPGIVQLFDYSRQGPPYYLVTEFVDGVEPRVWCRERNATPQDVAALVARMADAVECAHQQGVCHRDLKPGNVLVDANGQPHILDFGLARLEMAEDATHSSPTTEGHILGSLPYMSPEQASGQSHTADARSDVYSLGVILYELLTGRLPFLGPAHALPARVIEDAPPEPRCWNPELPKDLEAICLKALAKRPHNRYASSAAFASDLRAFLEGQPVQARRVGWLERIRRTLDRRHLETLRQGWTLLLLLLGATILTGCVVSNYWETNLRPLRRAIFPILFTKLVQVIVMLLLAWKLRPRDSETSESISIFNQPALTAAERQIWSLVPGYYGSFVTLMMINLIHEPPIPPAPVLSLLSGMGFATLGATIWGWFHVWSVFFFLLTFAITWCPQYGLTLLGLGWFTSLVVGSIHLQWTK